MKGRPEFFRLLQAFPDPCVVVDVDLQVVEVNDGFLSVTGTRREELHGRSLLDDVFPDPSDPEGVHGRGQLRSSVGSVLRTGRVAAAEVHRYDVASGPKHKLQKRYWSVVTSPLVGEDGVTDHLMMRVNDVTASHGLLAATLGALQAALQSGLAPSVDLERLTAALVDAERRGQSTAQIAVQVERLAEVLQARTVIEQAKGMLMATLRISADDAYALLLKESQHLNLKLRDVAARHVQRHIVGRSHRRSPGLRP